MPPLVADKTTFRRDQASRIRALGPNFHAMAEIHFATWSRWVASTGSSWYTAGVTARQRMAEAGYDVTRGDSWMLNELTSAVRRGDGNARANVRELLRGLYEGDGTRPTRGAVLVIGFGQRTSDVSVYQNTLQGWLADSAFWTDMATYVSDWSQEVYGDLRAHAVPGSPTSDRREYLNDYLQHKLVLAAAGPPEIEPARAFLRDAYSPLANGAWPRETAWGWTMVPVEQMAAYLSAQVNALRYFSATTRTAARPLGLRVGATQHDRASRTRTSRRRRDSSSTGSPPQCATRATSSSPRTQAAARAVRVRRSARSTSPEREHNGAWRSFRAWAQSTLTIGGVPATLAAGVAVAAAAVVALLGRLAPVTVTLRSSSPAGSFSTTAAGPWTSALTVPVAAGAGVVFYYRDTRAGRADDHCIGAGDDAGDEQVTVVAGAAARIAVTPASREIRHAVRRRSLPG